jgi:hypothetical protein
VMKDRVLSRIFDGGGTDKKMEKNWYFSFK